MPSRAVIINQEDGFAKKGFYQELRESGRRLETARGKHVEVFFGLCAGLLDTRQAAVLSART
jgi:hypothetical protein